MKLNKKWQSTAYLKRREVTQDDEGNDIVKYEDKATEIHMDIQSAGGVVNAQIWGEQLPYVKTCYYNGSDIKSGVNEKDGVCVYASSGDKPDFEIVGIQDYSQHKVITLKRL